MRPYILLSIIQILFLLLFCSLVFTVPVEDENQSMYLSDNLHSVGNITKEGGDGLSPEIFQLLLKGIDTIMNKIYPETYGKISVEDRTEIPRLIVQHFPAISIEQLEEIELMVDELIKEYRKMHSMAVTFYQRPKDGVMQKKRCNSQEDNHAVGRRKSTIAVGALLPSILSFMR
ncbi:hypothetical protein BD770DRAFT_407549 [Pilaira anomala]|nr:hypothetical protein BD770DRAFT_407549 [Pilaira anomala]